MNKELQKNYESLQHQREALLSKVQHVPASVLNQAPAAGKWSVNQILTHILTSERVSLGYMKKKSKGVNEVGNSGIIESLRLWVLIFSQRIPVKYKAPKVLVQNTPEALSLDELNAQWNVVRDDLAAFLDGIEEKNIRKIIYKHPFAGRLDVRQALIFLEEHIRHHTPQIERIINHPVK